MQLKVLYIDDEASLCEIFADEFNSDKIEVTTFTDPKLAIEAAKKNPSHLIFIDYRLPGITGDEVAQHLAKSTRKFLISGDIVVETDYQFESILSKPFDFEKIRRIFDTWFQDHGKLSP